MKKILSFFLLIFVFGSMVSAQKFCGNDYLEQIIYKKNPLYPAHKAMATKRWQDFNQSLASSKMIVSGKDTSYEIPVVVHIVHTGGSIGSYFNPDDTEIEDFINFLNKTWEATWPTFAWVIEGGTKIPIKFVLAKRDPECKPTNGILRVNGAKLPNYSINGVCPFGFEIGPSDIEMKSLSVWPPGEYYNIWLVNEIEGGGVGGYAPWPWYNEPSLIDGAVVDVKYARRISSDYSYTVAHEVGHSFGLYHTFQDGCAGSASCLTSGDELCDTEPHEFSGSFACTKGTWNSCIGGYYKGVEGNFMNYTDCPLRFTGDQRKRILYTLRNYRSGLIHSLGATAPDPTFISPKAACIPKIIDSESVFNIGPCVVKFANLEAASLGYYMDAYKSYIDRTCNYEPAIVDPGKTYDLSISTIGAPQEVAAWIDYNDDGIFQASEKIYSHSGLFAEETHATSITIPSSGIVTKRNLRMRIKSDIVSIADACSDLKDGQTEDFSVWIQSTTGIEQKTTAIPQFSLFPNPTTGLVHIKSDVASVFTLFDIEGRKVWSGENASEIDLSHLHNGVYFMEAKTIGDGLKIGMHKVVKCAP